MKTIMFGLTLLGFISPDDPADLVYYGQPLRVQSILHDDKVRPTPAATALAGAILDYSKKYCNLLPAIGCTVGKALVGMNHLPKHVWRLAQLIPARRAIMLRPKIFEPNLAGRRKIRIRFHEEPALMFDVCSVPAIANKNKQGHEKFSSKSK